MLPDLRSPAPPVRLALDKAALAANWQALDRLSGAATAGAAIKADAYGTGARRAAKVLAEAGCRDFFVAHWREAEEVLDLVPQGSLSVLHGPMSAADAVWAREAGVRPVLNSPSQVQTWLDAGGGLCDVMVDTGINRLGLSMADLADERLSRLEIDVLLSHLASAEEETPLNQQQLHRWEEVCRSLPHRRASLANSAGIALGRDYHGDLTRPGLALYGGVPCAALAPHIAQVVRPEAAIMQVRNIAAGESVGYNATFVAAAPMRVGVISLGYADGYLRCWSSRGILRAGDRVLPVLGRVSMDMTVIDLAAAPDLGEGDWVSADYALPEAARVSGLSQYELLTLLGRRFVR
ncbi:alanine racemase [Novosphingobium flavum]|uniref:Alanine racemase n=1 Tax=Novosphingobium flavum TaxID=1778672 RepID=A0A7X1KKZ0_9SPHN|nr:alanine racemase [Novosphingobium flavum]MBC2664695.1 alanine racemase [Novosphingobium flavum]